ncbi:F-box protein At4g35930-like [Impatiens glandulifera]|uniref:F-box protein At4g35930-like n=1 Tax=Impatiens glandulifera TaxID=253017 RepID=UPI001FB0DDB0|nr:F-box protein At4g35930-like [Impatiens glandulifera]
MGKVSPKEKTSRKRRRLHSKSSKYLKPGALAQIRYAKASASKPCSDIVVLDTPEEDQDLMLLKKDLQGSPLMLSPSKILLSPFAGISDIVIRNSDLLRTPKTPGPQDSESRLEALPMDILVNIICHLHHDQLRAAFHVSQRVRKAVVLARQFYFNFTTPDRSRQEMLRTITPLPTEHWPFGSKRLGDGWRIASPHPPPRPARHGLRPPRFRCADTRHITAVLFDESVFPSRKCNILPSVMPKPSCKSLASNRVLFYEDELCQAVAQNKLR